MIEHIHSETLEAALARKYRQYLTGHLGDPQPDLAHIDDDIEIGISDYREFTADKPHKHPVCTEHGFVLEGAVKVLVLDGSRIEYCYCKGDFFVVRPNTPCATKNAAGTRVLFIKSPGMNDKQLVEVDEETKAWLSRWE